MEEQTKRCSKCGEIKSVREFSKDKFKKSGLRSQCKLCCNLYQKAIHFEFRGDLEKDTKVCYKCGKEKKVGEFSKCSRAKDGLRTQCKECDAVYKAVYRIEHKEEISVKGAIYYQEHKEERAVYIALHKEERAAYGAVYRDEHKEEIAISKATWGKANPDKIRASSHRHYAKKKGNGGTHTAKDVKRQGEMQKWMCWWQGPNCKGYCKDEYDVDHIVPLDKGGHNNPSNIVISCVHCNRSKNNKLPEEWIGRLF